MSEEFEDVAVVETAPVESAVPVDTGAAYVPEALPSEVEATELNLNSSDDVLKNNDQQVYNEVNAPDRVSESVAPITAQAVAAKEERKAEERSQSFEAYEEQLKQSAARKEFMNKDHDFGDMKLSGADLTKLMDFISNPAMQDKLRERMAKSGVPKEKIDKGMKELNEYIELKKKEKEGKLSEEDQRKLLKLGESDTLKMAQQQTAQLAVDNGIKLSGNDKIEAIVSRTAASASQSTNAIEALGVQQAKTGAIVADEFSDDSTLNVDFSDKSTKKHVGFVAASARDDLPKTVQLTETFTQTNARQIASAATAAPSLTSENDSVAVIASANTNVGSMQRSQPAVAVASL